MKSQAIKIIKRIEQEYRELIAKQESEILNKESKDFFNTENRQRFSNSRLSERKMRLGQEVRDFEVNVDDDKEFDLLARATIMEDYLKKNKLCQSQ